MVRDCRTDPVREAYSMSISSLFRTASRTRRSTVGSVGRRPRVMTSTGGMASNHVSSLSHPSILDGDKLQEIPLDSFADERPARSLRFRL